MTQKKLVLYDMQIENEPLYIEFKDNIFIGKDNIFIGNEDQIICHITIEQALEILSYTTGTYREDKIYVPTDIEHYLKEFEKDRKREIQEQEMWRQIEKTEKVVQEIIKNKKGKE